MKAGIFFICRVKPTRGLFLAFLHDGRQAGVTPSRGLQPAQTSWQRRHRGRQACRKGHLAREPDAGQVDRYIDAGSQLDARHTGPAPGVPHRGRQACRKGRLAREPDADQVDRYIEAAGLRQARRYIDAGSRLDARTPGALSAQRRPALHYISNAERLPTQPRPCADPTFGSRRH